MGGFIQWHMVVICIWCALFVTSHHNLTLSLCFQYNDLAKFVNIICMFFERKMLGRLQVWTCSDPISLILGAR